MILFTPEHAGMIMAGRKTQTRRRGKKRWNVGAVHQARLALFGKPFAILRISDVRQERLGDIGPADVRREGYPDFASYREVWKRINGDWNNRELVWIVDFEVATSAKGGDAHHAAYDGKSRLHITQPPCVSGGREGGASSGA